MIELGKRQELTVYRVKEFGVYVGDGKDQEASVLLPQKQVPEGAGIGDKLEVFIYKDSEDRLIATTVVPKIEVGRTAVLEVMDVGQIGAFLDMGLEKDLLLPFKEQTYKVGKGERCLVALYIDKSRRLAATMKVYPYLESGAPYQRDDKVTGTVYEVNENLGVFVAVDNRYYGLIPKKEIFSEYHIGETVKARVTKVREDGKLDLSPREKVHLQMDIDAGQVMEVLDKFDGVIPFNDKVSPEVIKREFHLSKNAFKRAVGHLLKAGKIKITDTSIERAQEEER